MQFVPFKLILEIERENECSVFTIIVHGVKLFTTIYIHLHMCWCKQYILQSYYSYGTGHLAKAFSLYLFDTAGMTSNK